MADMSWRLVLLGCGFKGGGGLGAGGILGAGGGLRAFCGGSFGGVVITFLDSGEN